MPIEKIEDPKQTVLDKIVNANSILVTVSHDPSVDDLTAALGLTLILNKVDKHATAVFSGEMPPAIGFLQPDITFENSVDSLRDFIIALDKDKADRLRYKVEGDVVRVFITPYKTVLGPDDFHFLQGDFNIDLIIVMGVGHKDDLDTAITAHGKILHDAPVASIKIDPEQGIIGEADWTDPEASSLSEMVMKLGEALQPGTIDDQIATALLTGIISATDGFRNERTNPGVMSVASQLMSAGANQQLIVEKLEEAEQEELDKQMTLGAMANAQPRNLQDGSLLIEHDDSDDERGGSSLAEYPTFGSSDEVSAGSQITEGQEAEEANHVDEEMPQVSVIDNALVSDFATINEQPYAVNDNPPQVEQSIQPAEVAVSDANVVDNSQPTMELPAIQPQEIPEAQVVEVEPQPEESPSQFIQPDSIPDQRPSPSDSDSSWRDNSAPVPSQANSPITPGVDDRSLGGTFNATTEQAAEDKFQESRNNRNKVILSHDQPVSDEATGQPPVNISSDADSLEAILAADRAAAVNNAQQANGLADLQNSALDIAQPLENAPQPDQPGSPSEMSPQFSSGMLPPMPPAQDMSAMPDFSKLPPLPSDIVESAPVSSLDQSQPSIPTGDSSGQFQLPK